MDPLPPNITLYQVIMPYMHDTETGCLYFSILLLMLRASQISTLTVYIIITWMQLGFEPTT